MIFDFRLRVQRGAKRAEQRPAATPPRISTWTTSSRATWPVFRTPCWQRVTDLAEQEHLGITIDNARCKAFRRGSCRTFSPGSPSRAKTTASMLNDAHTYRTKPCSTPPRRPRPSPPRPPPPARITSESIQADAKAFSDLAAEIRKQSRTCSRSKKWPDDGAGADQRAGQNLSAAARRWQTARIAVNVEPRTAAAENRGARSVKS